MKWLIALEDAKMGRLVDDTLRGSRPDFRCHLVSRSSPSPIIAVIAWILTYDM